MDHYALAVITVAMAFLLLGASAEQPVGRQSSGTAPTSTTVVMQPARHHQRPVAADEDAAAMAVAERLPFVAAHHLPAAASSGHRPLPWAGSEAEAGELGLGGDDDEKELVRERQRPSSAMGDGKTTPPSQEQLGVKASSLLNRRTTSMVPGASDERAKTKTADTVHEDAELLELLNPDEPWLRNHCVVDRHDFRTGGHQYSHMLDNVDLCLFTWSERRSSEHWVLCPEPSNPDQAPCGYVIVPVRGQHGHKCALAFRADNLDLVAFANGTNKWHVFRRYAHLLPTATVLGFDNDYKDLIGREDEAMMPLSGTSLLQATSAISMYMKAPGVDDYYAKLALWTMVISIPEAKRFTPVRELIVSGWLEGKTLNEKMVEYLTRWRELSCALMAAEKTGTWGTDKDSKTLVDLDIAKSKQEASDIVDVLLDCPYQ